MRTIQVNLYQFDELDAKAKARARQWYRDINAGDNSFAEPVIDEAIEIAKRLGVTIEMRTITYANGTKSRISPCIWWSGFWNQGDGASFEGGYAAPDVAPPDGQTADDLVKGHAPKDEILHRIAARLDALQAKHGNSLTASITRSDTRYAHAFTMQVDVSASENTDVPIEDERELLNALRDFANWIYHELEDAYHYADSDEQIDETIRLNEYEFYDNGERAR